MVVIWPWRMPIASCTTFTTGARQLVVQDAAVSSRCCAGLVEMVVDADDDVERAVVLDRRRDDHPLHAAVEIALQLLRLQELAGAFEHDVAAEIAPGDVAGRRRGAEADATVADADRAVVLDAEALAPAAVDAVELEQMRRRRRAALELVDMHDIEPVARRADRPARAIDAAHRRAQRQPADAAHAVDADAHDQRLPIGAGRLPPPISSRRAFSAMRSSEAKGRL